MLALLLSLAALTTTATAAKPLRTVAEEQWRDILQGEWMIEFYAPWCPACKDMAKTWQAFSDWADNEYPKNLKVAGVDVTANPGLSGRFLVTALPTIYHVKNGVFRQYAGPRDKADFISFIEDSKWSVVEPIASWKHPDTPQGLPPAASYLIFGLATLVLGCILGFLIVCLIDCVFPASRPEPAKKQQKGKKEAPKKEEKKAKESDEDARASQDEESADEGEVRQRKGEKKANGEKSPSKEGKKKK